MNAKFRVAALSLALIVLAGLVLLLVRPGLNPARIRPMPLLIGAWLAFIAAAWLLRKVPLRVSVAAILLGGIAVQLVAVSAPSQNSTDLYRYVWDGRVQAAGIDPYEYVPAASQLTGLRDQGQDFLWRTGAQYCVPPSYVSSHPAAGLAAGCTAINRPIYPTIYPPVAEAYFLGVHYLPSGNDSTTPIQATTAFVAVLTTVLLLFGLGRLGRDIRMAALWSWCPTVALEAGNSAHVDVVAVAITAAAVLLLATARTTRRTVLGGILLGLAIATKLTPALTVPALLRRRWLTVTISAATAFVAVYIPHVLAVGGKVIGFLPGYLQQEGYTGGTRFGIIGLFFTGPLAVAVAALILGAVAFAVLQFGDPDRPWEGAVYMTAAALAVATPSYQWYSLLLVMLVALDGRPEWLAFAAGGYYAAEPSIGRYTVPYRLHLAVAYGVPVLVVAAGWLVRRALASRGLGVTRRGLGIAGRGLGITGPASVLASHTVTVAADAAAPAIGEARPVPGLAEARPVPGLAEARPVAGLAAPDDSFDAFSPRPVPADEPRDVRV
jgi:Glycosyltransferase family 87